MEAIVRYHRRDVITGPAAERQTEASFVLRWCLENYLPVHMLSRASTHVAF